MATVIVGDYVPDGSGDHFGVLFSKPQHLVKATDFFRDEYELFRGRRINSRITQRYAIDIGILGESGNEEISVLPVDGNRVTDVFHLKAWDSVSRLKSFYDSLRVRFE